jgi:hypothetical protein
MVTGRFKVECRYEGNEDNPEPDFVEEVNAPDEGVATVIVCDMDTDEHFVISMISEWHQPTETWVDVNDPNYAALFEGNDGSPRP